MNDIRKAWFPNDKELILKILREEWSLGTDEIPTWYCKPEMMMRNSKIGSVYVYDASGINNERIVGTNYEGYRRTHRITIDIMCPLEERSIRWLEEIHRILLNNRRSYKLRQDTYDWDYLQIGTPNPRTGYVGFYHTVMEITLTKEFKGIDTNGFGQKVCNEVLQ